MKKRLRACLFVSKQLNLSLVSINYKVNMSIGNQKKGFKKFLSIRTFKKVVRKNRFLYCASQKEEQR